MSDPYQYLPYQHGSLLLPRLSGLKLIASFPQKYSEHFNLAIFICSLLYSNYNPTGTF